MKKLMKSLVISGLLCACSKAYTMSKETVVQRIVSIAVLHKVKPSLALAVADTESTFDPDAKKYEPRLKTSSVGIFQLLLGTARKVGYTGSYRALMKPEINILYGIKYLSMCQDMHGSSLPAVSCCYNAGWAATRRFCKGHAGVQKHTRLIHSKIKKYLEFDPIELVLISKI